MIKLIRPIFYIAVLVVTVIAIQSHKSEIIKTRESTPISVLGLLQSEGVPVKTFKVEKVDLLVYIRKTLEKCSGSFCFYVSAGERRNIAAGEPVYDESGTEKIGEVQSAQGVDPVSGLARVFLKYKPNDKNKNDNFKVVNVAVQKIEDVIAIPSSSVEYDAKSAFVWAYNEGKPKKIRIKVGAQSITMAEVKSGLAEGDIIVSEGQGLLHLYDKARAIVEVTNK